MVFILKQGPGDGICAARRYSDYEENTKGWCLIFGFNLISSLVQNQIW